MELPKITSAFLNLTNSCNLACRYCFVEQKPEFMSLQVAKDAVEFLIKNAEHQGVRPSIVFFGGEPMLCWKSIIYPIIEHIRRERNIPFGLSMTTNGTLLTEDIITYLHNNDVGIMLSIDGAEETQNYNRPFHGGAGSFESVAYKIPLLLKYNPGMTFRSTLMPESCGHIFENIMFAEQCGYSNFFLIPNVFQAWGAEARERAEREFRRYTAYFIESCRTGRVPIRCSPLEDGFKRILEINSFITKGGCKNCKTAYGKCGLGAASFGSVDYCGNVYACQEMASCKGESDPFYIGSIYTGIQSDRRIPLINSFSTEKLVGEDCDTCKMHGICDGGCVANNYLWSGNVNHVSPDYCWWMKLMLNEAAKIVEILGDEKNECFRSYWLSLHGKSGCVCQS